MFCFCLVKLTAVILFLYYGLRYLIELIPVTSLKKKAIFITGCDSGFGHQFVLHCARQGLHVFAGCLNSDSIEVLAKEAAQLPGTVEPLHVDVTDEQSVREAKEFVEAKLSASGMCLWALVNNAGILPVYGPSDWSVVDDFLTVLDTNTLGVIRVTLEFLPLLKESKGRVVTTTSVLSRVCFPGIAPYQCSKYATAGFMDTLRQELRPFGIKCSIIEPEVFDTPLIGVDSMQKDIEQSWSRLDVKKKEEYGQSFKDYWVSFFPNFVHTYKSTEIRHVVEAYYHAVTAQYPRSRYYCGWKAIFFYTPLSLLPTGVHDLIIRLIVNQKKFPAVCSRTKTQ